MRVEGGPCGETFKGQKGDREPVTRQQEIRWVLRWRRIVMCESSVGWLSSVHLAGSSQVHKSTCSLPK